MGGNIQNLLCDTHFGRHRPLALEFCLVSFESLLSTVFQIIAGVVFRKAMLGRKESR